jgi:hypothetical protein
MFWTQCLYLELCFLRCTSKRRVALNTPLKELKPEDIYLVMWWLQCPLTSLITSLFAPRSIIKLDGWRIGIPKACVVGIPLRRDWRISGTGSNSGGSNPTPHRLVKQVKKTAQSCCMYFLEHHWPCLCYFVNEITCSSVEHCWSLIM